VPIKKYMEIEFKAPEEQCRPVAVIGSLFGTPFRPMSNAKYDSLE